MVATAKAQLIKMCLEENFPAGHARSDPIISQTCASGHVHTFYGPKNFHPDTTYEDLRDTPARFSSSSWVENQSLYWHPTVYEVADNGDGTKTYTRAKSKLTAYYRWDQSALPAVEAFPPGFRMIAHSNDEGADKGEIGGQHNLFVECCRDGTQDCETFGFLTFPNIKCDLMEIFFSMPTCWDGQSLGDDNDHKSHMKYTTNGKVNGPCPPGYPRRLPQIELNVNIGLGGYDGTTKTYELSDGASVWHLDFFNGWQEGKLQEIIDQCPFSGNDAPRNPDCGCTPNLTNTNFLTPNTEKAGYVCDSDVRSLILDEATDVTNSLPMGSCQGPTLIPRSWDQITDGLFSTCDPYGDFPDDSDDEDESSDEDGACVDQPLAFKDKAKWNCSWVGKKAGNRCKKQWKGSKLSEYCPVTCGTSCDGNDDSGDDDGDGNCVDDPNFRFKDKAKWNCAWVGMKATKRCKKNWQGTPISDSCPQTCGSCTRRHLRKRSAH